MLAGFLQSTYQQRSIKEGSGIAEGSPLRGLGRCAGLGARQLGFQPEFCSPFPLVLGHLRNPECSFLVCKVKEILWTSQVVVRTMGGKVWDSAPYSQVIDAEKTYVGQPLTGQHHGGALVWERTQWDYDQRYPSPPRCCLGTKEWVFGQQESNCAFWGDGEPGLEIEEL